MWQHILFDLDGTLTDPTIGITKSVRHALSSFGIHAESLDELECFIGPPLSDSFARFYGFEHEKTVEAIEKYREYFSVTGIFENAIYPGVTDMLESLRKSKRDIILATSKPTVFAKKILEHFHIAEYFSFVAGSELDGTRVKKAEVIAYALENVGIKDISACVMVGDREHDIIGAKAMGMDSIGVLYGYGDRAELEKAGADKIAATVGELKALLPG